MPPRAAPPHGMPLSSAARSSGHASRWARSSSSPSTVPAWSAGSIRPSSSSTRRMPLSRAMSPLGATARCTSATIAVLVTRGSTAITVAPAACAGEHPRHEERVVVGDVRAPEHQHVGLLEVVVAARWSVGAEAELVARDGARHAQGGVAVEVAHAHAEPHELAERVELLGDELAGGEDRHGVGSVDLDDLPEAVDHPVERVIPRRRSAVDGRRRQASGSADRVVLGEPLGQRPPRFTG